MIPLFIMIGARRTDRYAPCRRSARRRLGLVHLLFPPMHQGLPVGAARCRQDGRLKEWQIFLLIYVPVMRSTYAAAFIIVFMTSWTSYLCR